MFVYIVAAVASIMLAYGIWAKCKRAPAVSSKQIPEIPGIASHEKWRASLKLYGEGEIGLEDFLEAWRGWAILDPEKPKTYQYKVSTVWDGVVGASGVSGSAGSTVGWSGDLYSTNGSNADNVTRQEVEAITNPPVIGPKDRYVRMHYTCDGAETVTTSAEAYHIDYGWHPVKVDPYGQLYTSKSKLGGGA